MLQRPEPTRLVLTGNAIEVALALAAGWFDLRDGRNALFFPPAKAVVAGLGHLLRTQIASDAWLREAVFEFDIARLTLSAERLVLDDVADTIERQIGEPGPFAPLVLTYRDADDSHERRYDPTAALLTLTGSQVSALLEADPGILDSYRPDMAAALARFMADWRPALTATADFSLRVVGLGYDHGVAHEGWRRWSQEIANPGQHPSLLGRLLRRREPVVPSSVEALEATPPAADTATKVLSPALRQQVDRGVVILRDAPWRDGRADYLLISPAADSAAAVDLRDGRPHTDGWQPISEAELRDALAGGRRLGPEELR